MSNQALRDHVTSIGFSLTLSKSMIETVILLDHFKGWNSFHSKTRHLASQRNYVVTAQSLIRRGLMRDHGPGTRAPCDVCELDFCDHRLTRAGVLAARLLEEAGIYDEVLRRYGFDAEAVA